MNLKALNTRNVVLCCCALLLLACKQRPLRVELPNGYTGKVQILCGVLGDNLSTIHVGAEGKAVNVVCPKEESEIVITRDGQQVQLDGSVTWLRTGDGLPTAIQFNVR